jgi:hypothetical protein
MKTTSKIAFYSPQDKLFLTDKVSETTQEDCDLLIFNKRMVPVGDKPYISMGQFIPISEYPQSHILKFGIVKWVDERGVSPQEFVIFPIYGLMDGNKGADVCVGCGGRALIKELHHLSDPIYANEPAMKELGWRGFVTLVCVVDGDGLRVCELCNYIPWGGMYGMFEMISGDLIQHLINPVDRLWESWFVSSLVSIYPYPTLPTSPNFSFDPIEFEARKHCWYRVDKQNRKWSCEGGVVGFASAWGKTIKEVNTRILGTCDSITIPRIQYRTDLDTQLYGLSSQFLSLKDVSIIPSLSSDVGDSATCNQDHQ